MGDLEEQPVPEDAQCPECGADPLDSPPHKLSALGYTHDDILLTCSDEECLNQWILGVPIGESDYGDDLRCSCGTIAYPHKIDLRSMVEQIEDADDPEWGDVALDVYCKCPNCSHYFGVERTPDSKGIALVGNPTLTGSTEDAEREWF